MILENMPNASGPSYYSAAIRKNYTVGLGDDSFYNFIGRAVRIDIREFVHPDYREEFEMACATAWAEGSSRVLTMLCGLETDYQLVDIRFEQNTGLVRDEELLNLDMYNIFSMEGRYISVFNNMSKYRAFLSMYSDYLFDYDVELDLISLYRYMGVRSHTIFKCRSQEFYDMALRVCETPEQREEFEEFYRKLKEGNENFGFDIKSRLPKKFENLGFCHVECKVVYKHNRNKMVIGIIHSGDNNKEDGIPYYALPEGKDPLTGLFNKRACQEFVDETLRMDRERHYMAVIDVDYFKDINDSRGHLYGDEVLTKVGDVLNRTVNGRGIVGRFGGDEFFIFTNNIDTKQKIRSLLTSMRQKVEAECSAGAGKGKGRVTLSVGISTYPDDGNSYEELFNIADKCLYIAKNKGRNRYIIYDVREHGILDDKVVSSVGVEDVRRKTEKLAVITSEISGMLFGGGKERLAEALRIIRQGLEIDGIRIYSAKEKKLLYCEGEYKSIPDVTEFMGKNEQDRDGTLRWLLIGYTLGAETGGSEYCRALADSNIFASACCYFEYREGDTAFFFFDVFGRAMRWSEADKYYILTVSRIIGGIL